MNGAMIRRLPLLAVAVLALTLVRPQPAAAFSGFGPMRASSEYGKQITFSVDLPGGAPDRLELLLQFGPDPDATFVAPVKASGSTATYVWDASKQYLTPNTAISYRWRATGGKVVSVSPPLTIRYADNRPGLDWRSTQVGNATIHWYGSAESQARRFGDLTSGAVSRAESMLGHALDGPVDIFVYVSHDEFFGALGPGAREWTGAATFPNIRTVFMWLGGGPSDYLDTALVHEVTHVVFYDATRNPYHDPARWFNEGFAVWSEHQNADSQAATVRSETSAGLFSFSAIVGQFPIGSRGSSLSYAQGATMVDRIIRTYGAAAMSRIAAAYRAGATDAAALQAGTGVPATQLYADYFRSFGAAEPKSIAAASIGPSIVHSGSSGGVTSGQGSTRPNGAPASTQTNALGLLVPIGLAIAIVVILVIAGTGLWVYRRRRATDGS